MTAESGARAIMNGTSSFLSGDTQKPPLKRPSWRKSKQEIIDEKVERLFESQKVLEDYKRKQAAIEGFQAEQNKQNAKSKYFPEDDD